MVIKLHMYNLICSHTYNVEKPLQFIIGTYVTGCFTYSCKILNAQALCRPVYWSRGANFTKHNSNKCEQQRSAMISHR